MKRKYIIRASKNIKASFDPSMPDWLKNVITRGFDLISGDKVSKIFDLSNAEFLDTPTKHSIPIYYIDGVVYIPGVNDGYNVQVNGRFRQLGNIAKSKLPKLADDIVYVDLDQAPPVNKERYEDPRREYSKYRHGVESEYAGQHPSYYSGEWTTFTGRDKSGYKIPDPRKMLYNYYSQPGNIGKISNRLADTFDILNDIKTRIFDIDISDPTNLGRSAYSTAYGNMMSRFGSAVEDYSRAYADVKELISNLENGDVNSTSEYTDYTLKNILDNIRGARSRAKDVERYLDKLSDLDS
jgi:hypothetical protein